ncbi:MAG: hypothetical protein ACXVDQ_12405 [Bacteroidia bacterium]
MPDSFKNDDAVVLKEQITLTENSIYKRIAIKVLTRKGVDAFKKVRLPENFDLTGMPNFNRQGRFKDRTIPYIYNYEIAFFASRIISPAEKIIDLPSEFSVENTYWINNKGEKVDDKIYDFKVDILEPGDILEYTYKAIVNWKNMQQVIYPNGPFPKLDYTLNISWATIGSYKRSPSTLHYSNLKGINYLHNFPVGTKLPTIEMNQYYYNPSLYRSDYRTAESYFANDGYVYKWNINPDTLYNYYNDNYHKSIRKLISKFSDNTDSSDFTFLRKICDTLNNYKYVSNENGAKVNDAAVPFPDIFYKRKIKETNLLKNYEDLLREKRLFYYNGRIIDKRYAAVNLRYRNYIHMENNIIVIPNGNIYRYLVPRYNGLKYYFDELPFYFEGTTCVLLPCGNCSGNNIHTQMLMINTPSSSCDYNLRNESGHFKIDLDSMRIYANIREDLTGQLSTILRNYYTGDCIDSTISADYFKRCSDKPTASNIKITQISSSDMFPYKQAYHCTENLKLAVNNSVDLHDWFSFFWKKSNYTSLPNHDFYIDFMYTDNYNFLLEFNKPIEIANGQDLNKTISNDYFEIKSYFNKQDENKYLMNLTVKVKKNIVPEKDCIKLLEFVSMLDEINNFKVQLKR